MLFIKFFLNPFKLPFPLDTYVFLTVPRNIDRLLNKYKYIKLFLVPNLLKAKLEANNSKLTFLPVEK